MSTSAKFIVELHSKRKDEAIARGDDDIAKLCDQIVENVRPSGARLIVVEAKVLTRGVENVMRDADTGQFVAGSCFPQW